MATAPHTTLFLHGLGGTASQFEPMMQWMRETFSDATPPMHSLPLFEGFASVDTPMLTQRDALVAHLTDRIGALNLSAGFNFVAHSQGALLARSAIEALPPTFPPVLTYISLAGPHAGQFGMCRNLGKWANSSVLNALTRDAGWLTLYNPIGQRLISVANYWNDPSHQALFRAECGYLPKVNNLVAHADAARYKSAFLRLRRAVFLGSDGDDCINPPLSSVFEYVDAHGKHTAMNTSAEYVNDTFGLRSMAARGELFVHSPSGLDHDAWRLQKELFRMYVAPNLL